LAVVNIEDNEANIKLLPIEIASEQIQC